MGKDPLARLSVHLTLAFCLVCPPTSPNPPSFSTPLLGSLPITLTLSSFRLFFFFAFLVVFYFCFFRLLSHAGLEFITGREREKEKEIFGF
jgi:hypothetical protein